MKRTIATIFIVTLSSLLLAGCGGISKGERENVLDCLKKAAYINENDTLENSTVIVGDSDTSDDMYYDYFYYDKDGELYNVRIHPKKIENETMSVYDVNIYYDVEVAEENSGTGKNNRNVWKMEDYEDSQEIQVQKLRYMFFTWYEIGR